MGVYDGTLGNRNREGARTCSSMIMRDKQGGGFFFLSRAAGVEQRQYKYKRPTLVTL